MIRLHAVVEGQAEETFVNIVLAPQLTHRDVFMDCRRIKTGRHRGRDFRGGLVAFGKLRNDLALWMKQDRQPEAWFTTMIDLYALPKDFPGYDECGRQRDAVSRVECLERRLLADLGDHRRFVPYIQLHEFEALLFSEPRQFEVEFPGRVSDVERLESVRRQFETPEEIDNTPDGHPSERIRKIFRDYQKVASGAAIAGNIGLSILRRECPQFNQWVGKIEAAAQSMA